MSRWQDIVALALVLLVAAAMRFVRLDAVEFFHDEAMVSMMAQELAHGETFPLVGILSSVGIPNPPAAIYVMAVPFAISSDPVFATGYVALLNVIGVGLLWGIARKEFGFAAALVAGLVFAVNPWAVLYSRKIWAQDFVNPFLLLALTAALWGFKDGKRWGQIAALPLMLFAMQIHFAAWALVPLFAWIGWIGRRNIHRGAVLLSVVLGVIVMLPYLIGLTQTLQADPTRIADTLGREGITDKQPTDALRYATELALGVDMSLWVTGWGYGEPGLGPDFFSRAPIVTLGLILVFGMLSLVWRRLWWAIGFLFWIILPGLAFQFGLADIWPHYFVPQLPAFALLVGVGFSQLARNVMIPNEVIGGVWLVLCWLAAISLFMFGFSRSIAYFVVMDYAYSRDIEIGPGTSGYTTPMFVLGAVRDAIPPDIDDVIVLSDGDRVWFDVEAARWPVMLRDRTRCVRTLSPDGLSVQPDGRYVVIMTPSLAGTNHRVFPVPQGLVIPARHGGEGNFEGYYRIEIHDALAHPNLPDLARFSNGVGLKNWSIDSNRIELEFTLPDAPDRTFYGALEHDYQYFIHLLDADGNRIGQKDASFWPGRHWCQNDRLTLTATVENSAPVATIRFGFYKLLDAESGTTQAVDILDEAGNPAGNWVDIPVSSQ